MNPSSPSEEGISMVDITQEAANNEKDLILKVIH